jgi:uncharacterized oligopeptide transporter (OPT) family protein
MNVGLGICGVIIMALNATSSAVMPLHTHSCCLAAMFFIPLQGNGVIVGLGICGVVINATSSAATLMGDFRTGYICLAAPRAMFGAQLVGQLLGALITPMAFMLFYRTGQVRILPAQVGGEKQCDFRPLLSVHQLVFASQQAASVVLQMQLFCSFVLKDEASVVGQLAGQLLGP